MVPEHMCCKVKGEVLEVEELGEGGGGNLEKGQLKLSIRENVTGTPATL